MTQKKNPFWCFISFKVTEPFSDTRRVDLSTSFAFSVTAPGLVSLFTIMSSQCDYSGCLAAQRMASKDNDKHAVVLCTAALQKAGAFENRLISVLLICSPPSTCHIAAPTLNHTCLMETFSDVTSVEQKIKPIASKLK